MRAAVTFRNEAKVGPYVRALEAVGLEAALISADRGGSLDSVDGLLLTGGTDINPARYGQEPAPETQPADDARDELETGLLRKALDRGVPVLAICRGMQLFNVVHGGTLLQHLPASGPHQGEGRDAVAHNVRVAAGTRLASILSDGDHAVNSRHHQAADRPGQGLIVSAVAPDGVIEALERPDQSFAVAVQWHPEDRILVSTADRRLFEAFAQAVRSRAATLAGRL